MNNQVVPVTGMTPWGQAFNPKMDGKYDYFWYGTSVTGIAAAGGIGQSTIQFDADSQYALIAITYQADIALAAVTEATNVIPLVTVNMQDGGSGKYLMNQPIALPAIGGDGKNPYRLIGPRIFQPNSTLNINWVNYSAASVYNVRLVFHGIKIYT